MTFPGVRSPIPSNKPSSPFEPIIQTEIGFAQLMASSYRDLYHSAERTIKELREEIRYLQHELEKKTKETDEIALKLASKTKKAANQTLQLEKKNGEPQGLKRKAEEDPAQKRGRMRTIELKPEQQLSQPQYLLPNDANNQAAPP